MYKSPGCSDNIFVTYQILNLILEFRTKNCPAREQSQQGAESQEKRLPLERLLRIQTYIWPYFLGQGGFTYHAIIFLEQATLLFCLVQRVIIGYYCYAFWEIIFVSNQFLVILGDLLEPSNSREVIFYSAFKDSRSPKYIKVCYIFKIYKKEYLTFSSKFISEYNMGRLINKL